MGKTKAAVFSDTHSRVALAIEAIQRWKPDMIIHLGDYVRDAQALKERFPEIPMVSVRGNCDFGAKDTPLNSCMWIGGTKVLMCHGHEYDVKWGLHSLYYAAAEQDAELALFGHTHIPTDEDYGGIRLVNPGTAGEGRDCTWAKLIFDDDGSYTVSIEML